MDKKSEPDPSSFWTVKIAGVSGSGKTTLLSAIKNAQRFECTTITYSTLLKQHGNKDLADRAVEEILHASNCLILMDDHLEFENPYRVSNYIKQNTRGLILLHPPVSDIVDRIEQDNSKCRNKDLKAIEQELEISKYRAMELVSEIGLDLLVLENLNGDLDYTINKSLEFIQGIH
jgi:adenylate kinase